MYCYCKYSKYQNVYKDAQEWFSTTYAASQNNITFFKVFEILIPLYEEAHKKLTESPFEESMVNTSCYFSIVT